MVGWVESSRLASAGLRHLVNQASGFWTLITIGVRHWGERLKAVVISLVSWDS